MNKSEVIDELAQRHNLSIEDATLIVSSFFNSIRSFLCAGRRVEIRGFGSFKPKDYKGYTGRNPKTGVLVTVPPKRLSVFRAGKELREMVNE